MAEKRKISIVTDKKKDICTLSVNGAWGGVSPNGNGSIIVNLYQDQPTIPTISDVEIDENGVANMSNAQNITRGDITREVQAIICMSPTDAINIGKWLTQKGEEGLNIIKGSLK